MHQNAGALRPLTIITRPGSILEPGWNASVAAGNHETSMRIVDAIFRAMTLTPTIGIQGGHQLLTLKDGSWLDDARIKTLFPATASEPSRALRAKPSTPADIAAREALVAPQERLVSALHKAGGRIIAGTDSPINPYGLSLLLEIEHYVRGGLTPAEALLTATAVPAQAMGLGAELGTIEPGKLADLVVVDGNPLENIADLRKTRTVVKDGVVYQLDALLKRP